MWGICSPPHSAALYLDVAPYMCVSYLLRRVIGYMVMEDEKGQDEKVACPLPLPVPLCEAKHERPLRTETGLCCAVVWCV